jgi:hypothetical protein|tara:strand:+ start:302 stop:466 length:165 start_codon:yes stop_codon:yes gene_type:complete
MSETRTENWEDCGDYQTDECGIDRWVCKYCGDDLPLDQGDIIEHLEDEHEERLY